MKVICIDDEKLALEYTKKILYKIDTVESVETFRFYEDALVYLRDNNVDVVFLDIEMFDVNGIEVAMIIKRVAPQAKIIFLTAYSNYAIEAFKVKAYGYLMKPATLDAIKEELDHINDSPLSQDKKIQVKTFGNFDIYVNGKIIKFARSKSKELLAYLVDKKGTSATGNEIIAAIWEDKDDSNSTKSLFRNLVSDITSTLKAEGIENLFVKSFNSYAINPDIIDCDYYRFLAGDVQTINSFTGEYMANYSWAEFTSSYLLEKVEKYV